MTIIAERGLFVRLLVQSGKFGQPDAEALADALDAAAKDPATQADVQALRTDLKATEARLVQDIALMRQRLDQVEKVIDAKIEAAVDKVTSRFAGIGLAIAGLLFAALRFT